MVVRTLILLSLLIAAPSIPVGAQEQIPLVELLGDTELGGEVNEWHSRMAECFAYYKIAAEGMRNNGDERTANAYETSAEVMLGWMFLTHRPETGTARVELYVKEQIKAMHNNYANISILINRYADSCKVLVEVTPALFQSWVARTE